VRRWFDRFVLARWWTCFITLGISFFVFGACTLNLFFLFRANAALVVENGWQAIGDGAAQQFFELLSSGFLGMLAYVVFKACEHSLVHRLTHPPALRAPAQDENRDPPR
jgi:hypothetical protein